MTAIVDQTAYVEQELTIELRAHDPDGDNVTFEFAAADLPDVGNRASVQTTGKSEAVFRYTPIISDVGVHAFDFVASDGKSRTSQTVTITVKLSETGGTGPTFRKPAGTGTTLDLNQKECGTVEILIEDPDSTEVLITEEEPRISGATLTQDSGLSGLWRWCPTKEQIAASDRYMLRLGADDGSNPKVIKEYLIVLRKPQKPNCPGEAPVIAHTPENQTTLLPVLVVADITDDKGIKNEPLLYYAYAQPSNPPDVGAMTQLSMLLLSGTATNGTWGAEIPNPVANAAPGATADIFYVIVAQDNDDEGGDCDHLTQVPETGAYKVTVTRPASQQGRGLCESCTSDAQCGGGGDHCLAFGGSQYCGKACAKDADCGDPRYYCSILEWTSVDGAVGRQCLPSSLSCPPPSACEDDAQEPNGNMSQVQSKTPLVAGTYSNLRLCPAGSTMDEDWYPIELSSEAQVTVTLAASSPPDIDLALLTTDGKVVARSNGTTSNESVTACLSAGRYYIRVYGFGSTGAGYTLTYSRVATSCHVCEDDSFEDDDGPTQARAVTLSSRYVSTTNAICAGDDDWYKVTLQAGQKLYVTLAFTQTSAAEDLDIRFYQQGSGGTILDLTNCTEVDVTGCSSSNGQSTTSNENFTYTATATATYYVVVHGWNGAENLYDICIALSNASGTGCPPLPN